MYVYLSTFVRNETLIWLALILLTLFMGNSVVDSDLTFNTYMDITVYLLAALVIVKKSQRLVDRADYYYRRVEPGDIHIDTGYVLLRENRLETMAGYR